MPPLGVIKKHRGDETGDRELHGCPPGCPQAGSPMHFASRTFRGPGRAHQRLPNTRSRVHDRRSELVHGAVVADASQGDSAERGQALQQATSTAAAKATCCFSGLQTQRVTASATRGTGWSPSATSPSPLCVPVDLRRLQRLLPLSRGVWPSRCIVGRDTEAHSFLTPTREI